MNVIQKAKAMLITRAQKYRSTFDNVNGEYVLKDLAHFCRANESTFHADARISDVLTGRREVFLRICHHLKLSEDELYKLYK